MRRPSFRVLGPLVLGALVTASTPALAETLRLEQPAEVLNRPRSSGRALVKLEKGDKIRVIERKGDWVQVMARGEKGWLPASALEAPSEGWPAGQRVQTTASAELRTKPGKGKVLFEVEAGEPFKVVAEEGDWVEVVDETETRGWLPKDALAAVGKTKGAGRRAVAEAPAPAPSKKSKWARSEPRDEPEDEEAEAAPRKKDATAPDDAFEIDGEEEEQPAAEADDEAPAADADEAPTEEESEETSDGAASGDGVERSFTKKLVGGLGYRAGADLAILSLSQSFDSDGTGLRNHYALTNNTPVLVLRGTVDSAFDQWIVGVDASMHLTFAGKGMSNGDATAGEMSDTIGWSELAMDAQLRTDYVIDPQWTVGAAVGGYRWRRTVDADEVLGLPSEASGGMTVGLRGGWHKDKWSANAGFDLVATAKLRQRSGLRDGASSDVSGQRYRLVGGYRVNGNLTAEAGYHGTRTSYSFAGAADRSTEGGKRKDTSHIVTVGAAWMF